MATVQADTIIDTAGTGAPDFPEGATGIISQSEKQYLGDGTDFTITGSPAVTSLVRAVAIPYQTSDGAWRLRFNIQYNVGSGARTNARLDIIGVTFKNVAEQSISAMSNQNTSLDQAWAQPNTDNCQIVHASATTIKYTFSGDVELESKPTWAD